MRENRKIPDDFFSRTHIDWDKTKESIWNELEKKMADSEAKVVHIIRPWLKIAMAAAIVLLIGLTTISLTYRKIINVPAAHHSDIELPDGSQVRINSQSTLDFKPLLFRVSRSLKFNGEAFFDVKAGKKFTVNTGSGSISVLGTSFNVFARKERYEVTCITGKILVTGRTPGNPVVISPSEKAVLGSGGDLQVESDINTDQSLSWLENKLFFTSVPLNEVFQEVERQYNITIHLPSNLDYTYTGTFKTDVPVEQILTLVCMPFDLAFSQHSANEYIISQSEQIPE